MGIKDWTEIEEIRAAINLPLMLGGTAANLADTGRLASLGVAIFLQGHQTAAAVVQALQLVCQQLREGASASGLSGLASAALMKQVTRTALYDDWAQRFMSGPDQGRK